MSARSQSPPSLIPAFFRDIRVLQAIGQIVFVIIVVAFFARLSYDIVTALNAKGLTLSFGFLGQRAGFDIAEHPDWYSSNSLYWQAFVVGVMNTLRIALVGLVASTLLGIFVGIFLLSRNWLVRNISRTYVEVLRNTPLLVQLFVWYNIVILSLPLVQQAIGIPNEGVLFLPIRYSIYLVLLFLIWLYFRMSAANREQRARTYTIFIAAAILIEIAFWLNPYQRVVDGQFSYGVRLPQEAMSSGIRFLAGMGDFGNPVFLIYLIISVALIALAWRRYPDWLWYAVGQLVGGLLFYFGVVPASTLRLETYPAVVLSNRGIVTAELVPTSRFADWFAFVAIGVTLALVIWIYAGRVTETTGRPIRRGWYAFLSILIFVILGWFFSMSEPLPETIPVQQEGETVYRPLTDVWAQENLAWQAKDPNQMVLTRNDRLLYSSEPVVYLPPLRRGLRFFFGSLISPEYMALLIGLVVYTSAFIAEIVRAGIQAVPPGQLEAARALGLSYGQLLRLVILPQALRVIIPPLGNQYLNLTKNSSLAIAVAYGDLFQITYTIMNQSGQSVQGMMMVMLTYLFMSLTIATVMFFVNRRFQLVTR
jgi:His/Glu/Gln/Arg/opine family amino acid ABC transporter permease subunit